MDPNDLKKQESALDLLALNITGNKVKALINIRNLSQKDLAFRIGVTQSEVSRVINGKRKTAYIRQAIANELGLPVERLFL
jgi:transcriptional regulator with XRE-family HTH domain